MKEFEGKFGVKISLIDFDKRFVNSKSNDENFFVLKMRNCQRVIFTKEAKNKIYFSEEFLDFFFDFIEDNFILTKGWHFISSSRESNRLLGKVIKIAHFSPENSEVSTDEIDKSNSIDVEVVIKQLRKHTTTKIVKYYKSFNIFSKADLDLNDENNLTFKEKDKIRLTRKFWLLSIFDLLYLVLLVFFVKETKIFQIVFLLLKLLEILLFKVQLHLVSSNLKVFPQKIGFFQSDFLRFFLWFCNIGLVIIVAADKLEKTQKSSNDFFPIVAYFLIPLVVLLCNGMLKGEIVKDFGGYKYAFPAFEKFIYKKLFSKNQIDENKVIFIS